MRLAHLLVFLIIAASAAWTPTLAAADSSPDDALRQRVADAEERVDADPDDRAARHALAEALYFLATRGKDGRAAKRAESLFTDLHRLDREAAQPTAYLGSLKLLRSSKTWAVWDKEKLARQGLALLDDAVAAAPEDPKVRFIRAVTTFSLPEWFERGPQSDADFALLAQQAEPAVETGELEPWLAASALFHHGQWRERAGDAAAARAAYESATRIAPDSHAAAEARNAIARLTE